MQRLLTAVVTPTTEIEGSAMDRELTSPREVPCAQKTPKPILAGRRCFVRLGFAPLPNYFCFLASILIFSSPHSRPIRLPRWLLSDAAVSPLPPWLHICGLLPTVRTVCSTSDPPAPMVDTPPAAQATLPTVVVQQSVPLTPSTPTSESRRLPARSSFRASRGPTE